MLLIIITLVTWLSLFLSSVPAYPAVFNISSGDVAGLIAAINAANSSGEENTIKLEPGTYTLTSVYNELLGITGLPVITSVLRINGGGAESTIIERDSSAAAFRILQIGTSGKVTLVGLTVRGGLVSRLGGCCQGGGGILNLGDLTIEGSIIERNSTSGFRDDGGSISNAGTLTLLQSTVARNYGGGIYNCGAATIANSTIRSNEAEGTAGIMNGPATHETCLGDPTMTITNSTIAKNRGIFGVGGLDNTGNLSIKNSTIISNVGPSGNGGLFNSGVLELQNTILSFNREPGGTACSRPFTSLGNNLIFDPLDCITLQPSDLTGDLGLGGFVDSGAPGNGRFPLLDTSQAIDRGNNDACSSDPALASDQLGQPRSVAGTLDAPRICDIGAVEFFPVVNNLVQLHEGELVTEFDPTPSPRAPAGTFVITATFDNISNERIFFPFFEVAVLELQRTFDTPPDLKCSVAPAEDQPVLLNADGGSGRAQCPFVTPLENEMTGGAGARLTPADSFNTPFEPGATKTFQFRIGLQKQEPFIFFVNMLGEPRTFEFLC